jgi:hypothetical protein
MFHSTLPPEWTLPSPCIAHGDALQNLVAQSNLICTILPVTEDESRQLTAENGLASLALQLFTLD